MADVGIEQLKEDIQDNIKTNNSQAITGAVLQGQLIDTVDTLKGYTDDHVSVSQNTSTGDNSLLAGSTVLGRFADADKLIKLVGMGVKSAGTSGVTAVDDIYYNTTTKVLYRCTAYASPTSFTEEEVPYYDGTIYTFDNKLYIWDGNNLSLKTPSIEIEHNTESGEEYITKEGEELAKLLNAGKLVKIEGIGTISGGNTGVTAVGQYYLSSLDYSLCRCINYPMSSGADVEYVPHYDGALYLYNGELYFWNGTTIQKTTKVVEDLLDVERKNTKIIDESINTREFNLNGAGSELYYFKAGVHYNVIYNAPIQMTISTRNAPLGSTVDVIAEDVTGLGSVLFTPTADATYLRCGNKCHIFINIVESVADNVNKICGQYKGEVNATILNGKSSILINPYTLSKGIFQALITGIEKSLIYCYNSDYTKEKVFPLNNNKPTIVDIPDFTDRITIATADGGNVANDTPVTLKLYDIGYYSHQVNWLASKVDRKLDIDDKNLYNGQYIDNSVYDSNGEIVTSPYWAIAEPIDVEGHDDEKLYISNTTDASNRYHLFELKNGAKRVVACTKNYIRIPKGAKVAHIALYKINSQIASLIGAQISFSKIGADYPRTGISGYLNETEIKKISFPPSPQTDLHSSYSTIKSAEIYARWNALVTRYPDYIEKVYLGMDSSGTLPINAYKVNFAKRPIFKIVWLCNQHGPDSDPIMGALISAIMAEDLCGSAHRHNSWLDWIRNNVSINVIPCCNPWGIDNEHRTNYNGVNLNRNWPTSSWDSYPSGEGTWNYKGQSAASEVETQYMISFINSIMPQVVIDNHTLGGTDGVPDANSGMFIIGQPYIASNKAYLECISKYRDVFKSEYGMTLNNGYDNIAQHLGPDAMNWIYEHNLYGGLIEMQWRDPLDSDAGFTSNIIEASYMLALFIYKVYSLLLFL